MDDQGTMDLRGVIGFDDGDLAENRQGRLSQAQISRLTAREHKRRRQLGWFASGAAVAGVALTFYAAVLGMLAFAVAGGALVLRWVTGWLAERIAANPRCEAVSGPVERHRRMRDHDGGGRVRYELWAGVRAGDTHEGRPVTAAEKVFKLPKPVWEAFVDGAHYTVFHHQGRVVAAVREDDGAP